MRAKDIIIDPEFRDLIPPLQPKELEQLHNSLCGDGCREALIIWKGENILVDGHNRFAYLKEHEDEMLERGFEIPTIERRFGDREQVKRFIILNQLGRRNVTPETASMLRAQYEESMSMGRGGNRGNQHTVAKCNNCTLPNDPADVLAEVAEETGVSRRTVANDVRLMRALDKLGISRNDYAAGKVLDANGKKRSKKSILDEAFPPKKKKTTTAQAAEDPATDEGAPLIETIVIEDEDEQPTPTETEPEPEIEPWTTALLQIPKLSKHQRQELHDLLETRWDCKPSRS